MKNILILLSAILIIMFSFIKADAQPGSMPGQGYDPGVGGQDQDLPPDDAGVPVDGGISLLVVAGIGFGVTKVRAQRKLAEKQNFSIAIP